MDTSALPINEMATISHNGTLDIALNLLSKEHVLEIGATAFEESAGSTSDRLAAALTAMLAIDRMPAPTLEIPEGLENMTVPQIRASAYALGVHFYGLRRKADLIEAFHREQRRRARMA